MPPPETDEDQDGKWSVRCFLAATIFVSNWYLSITSAGSGLPRDFGVMTKILINFLLPFRSISRDPLAGDTINGMANSMNRG